MSMNSGVGGRGSASKSSDSSESGNIDCWFTSERRLAFDGGDDGPLTVGSAGALAGGAGGSNVGSSRLRSIVPSGVGGRGPARSDEARCLGSLDTRLGGGLAAIAAQLQ